MCRQSVGRLIYVHCVLQLVRDKRQGNDIESFMQGEVIEPKVIPPFLSNYQSLNLLRVLLPHRFSIHDTVHVTVAKVRNYSTSYSIDSLPISYQNIFVVFSRPQDVWDLSAGAYRHTVTFNGRRWCQAKSPCCTDEEPPVL